MSTLPLHRLGLHPTVEALGLQGIIEESYAPLGIGGVWNAGGVMDVSAYGIVRLLALSDVASAAGGVTFQWYLDEAGTRLAFTDTFTALAATLLDTGAIEVGLRTPYLKVQFVNGAIIQATFSALLMVGGGAGGGGGVGDATAANQLLQLALLGALPESHPAPDPAATLGATAQRLRVEPDGRLQTRGGVTTDEGTFAGNFPGVSIATAIVGNLTLATGSTVWSRVAATTPLTVGQYLQLDADDAPATPRWVQIDTVAAGGLAGTLCDPYAGAGGTAAGSVSDWIIGYSGAGAGITNPGGVAQLSPGLSAAGRCFLAQRLGPGGRKGCAPLWARFLPQLDQRRANQQVLIGLSSGLGAAATLTQLAAFALDGTQPATKVDTVTALDASAGLASSNNNLVMPNGGATSDANPHLFEVEQLEDQALFYVDGTRLDHVSYVGHDGVLPRPYQEMYLLVQIENTGVPAGVTVLTVLDAHAKSFDLMDARVVQPDADKLQMTGPDLRSLATNLPGFNNEFYPSGGPLTMLSAIPQLLAAPPNGGVLALDIDPLAGAEARVRVLRSTPIPIAGAGLTGCTFTNGSPTVTLTGTVAGNVVVGQLVYFAADGAKWAVAVDVVAPGGGNTVLTLHSNYLGAGGAGGAGNVCGLAAAVYPAVGARSSNPCPADEIGVLPAGDVLIVYADAAYAGATVSAERTS